MEPLKLLDDLVDLFYPKACAGCDSLLVDGENCLCAGCVHELPLTNHLQLQENEAFKRFYGRLPVEHVSAMCYFSKDGIVQELMHKLKYKGQKEIGSTLGRMFGTTLLEAGLLRDVDIVVPVPLHARRMKERGYNQSAGFAKEIAVILGAQYNDGLLKRNSYALSQTKKNLLQRSEQTMVYEVENYENYVGKHILIVDDIMTTGATLEACGKALLAIPDVKISIACMAFTAD